jgi:hypothetical protein
MEALFPRLLVCAAALASLGASHRTPNFVVNASTPELAQEIGAAAEKYRVEMAELWLGHTLPDWSQPCPITADVGEKGAGGVTSFVFDRGEVYRWEMAVQGTRERVLDSVLPHEVTHTIFASHFRQQLPRWADEGACTTVEHNSERDKHRHLLVQFLQTGRGIAFNDMFRMKEYPHDILPLYSQGHALAQFLIGKKGPKAFVRFVEEGLDTDDWAAAVDKHYGFHDLSELQTDWLAWVKRGCPEEIAIPEVEDPLDSSPTFVAASLRGNAIERQPRPTPNLIYRAQNAPPSKKAKSAAAPRPVNGVSTDGWRAPAGNRRMRSLSGDASMTPTQIEADPTVDDQPTAKSDDVAREVIFEWRRDDHRVR